MPKLGRIDPSRVELIDHEARLRPIDLSQVELIDHEALFDAVSVANAEALTEVQRKAVSQYVSAFDPGLHLEDWGGIQEFLSRRFCDFPDPVALGSSSRPMSYSEKGIGPRPLNLTYTVDPSAEAPAITTAAQKAFGTWSFAAPALAPQFRSVGPADVTFGIAPLAPPKAGSTKPDGSRITLATGKSSNSNFARVVLHEVGHALGLLHATTQASVMYPIAYSDSTTLLDDDVSAIRARYGWTPQRNIPGRGTDCGPAICAYLGRLVMAWKGIGDDHNIWFATSRDGISWSDQRMVPGAATNDQPALTTGHDGRLIMAFHGIPGDGGLYWVVSNDGNTWGPVAKIDGVGSSHGPSFGWQASSTPDSDQLFMAWKGWDNDAGLYFARFKGNGWEGQKLIGGVGSADRPSLTTDVDGSLRMVWRGIPGDNQLYTSVLHGIFWEPQQIVEWIEPGNGDQGTARVDHALSALGPSALSRFTPTFFVGETPATPNKVFLAWRGDDNEGLYFTQRAIDLDGSTPVPRWSSQVNIPGVGSSHRPAMAWFNGVLHLAWKGAGSDTGIWTNTLAVGP